MSAAASFGENPLSHEVAQVGVVTPPTPARRWCPNRTKPKPAWLPPDKFCCPQDHYLQGEYGITCDDWWELYTFQQGRCAICGQPEKGRRLVVDHNHRTGSIDGLAHFGCNRRLHDQVRQYLAYPPGRHLGLRVAPAKLKAIRDDDAAKRRRERQRREERTKATQRPSPGPSSGLDRLKAMTKQGGT